MCDYATIFPFVVQPTLSWEPIDVCHWLDKLVLILEFVIQNTVRN